MDDIVRRMKDQADALADTDHWQHEYTIRLLLEGAMALEAAAEDTRRLDLIERRRMSVECDELGWWASYSHPDFPTRTLPTARAAIDAAAKVLEPKAPALETAAFLDEFSGTPSEEELAKFRESLLEIDRLGRESPPKPDSIACPGCGGDTVIRDGHRVCVNCMWCEELPEDAGHGD